MKTTFGKQLKKLRQEAGLTQKGLGEKIHVDGSMISRFEHGVIPRKGTVDTIIAQLELAKISRQPA